MFADPRLTPVTFGIVEDVVAPAGITTLAGLTVSLLVSLLTSETVSPPAGAGVDKVTGSVAVWPKPTVTLAGSETCATFTTVTVVVPGTMPEPDPDAVMVVLPGIPGVTVAFTTVEPAGTVTLAGTVATLVLLLDRLTIWPLVPPEPIA